MTRPPFTLPNPGTRNMQARGAGLAMDWLAGFPGGTWQQRWHASGAEDAGARWKQGCAGWMDVRGIHAGNRMDELSIGLILAICADIVRPGLPWLTASGVSPGALARNLERTRDHAGLSRLRKAIDDGAVSVGARHAAIRRAAVIMAAKGGTLTEIVSGDFLELLDAERGPAAGPATTAPCRGGCYAKPACSGRGHRNRWPRCSRSGSAALPSSSTATSSPAVLSAT